MRSEATSAPLQGSGDCMNSSHPGGRRFEANAGFPCNRQRRGRYIRQERAGQPALFRPGKGAGHRGRVKGSTNWGWALLCLTLPSWWWAGASTQDADSCITKPACPDRRRGPDCEATPHRSQHAADTSISAGPSADPGSPFNTALSHRSHGINWGMCQLTYVSAHTNAPQEVLRIAGGGSSCGK
jgi:hypothetical protein